MKQKYKWGKKAYTPYEHALFSGDRDGVPLANEVAALRERNQTLEKHNAELLSARDVMINHLADLRLKLDILQGTHVKVEQRASA